MRCVYVFKCFSNRIPKRVVYCVPNRQNSLPTQLFTERVFLPYAEAERIPKSFKLLVTHLLRPYNPTR